MLKQGGLIVTLVIIIIIFVIYNFTKDVTKYNFVTKGYTKKEVLFKNDNLIDGADVIKYYYDSSFDEYYIENTNFQRVNDDFDKITQIFKEFYWLIEDDIIDLKIITSDDYYFLKVNGEQEICEETNCKKVYDSFKMYYYDVEESNLYYFYSG